MYNQLRRPLQSHFCGRESRLLGTSEHCSYRLVHRGLRF